ncbi:hypothetical protein PENSPDRAFT_293085 [Peniophora sp. CONT]|nr:hypothetical protein PENSPDRAFT_293085 [Peniophora sp. CONT]
MGTLVQPTTVLRSPLVGSLGYGRPPDNAAADAFLGRLQTDPKGIVERFITMCRTRQPRESLTSTNPELWYLADQLMAALMHLITTIGRQTWDAIIDTGLIDLYQDLIVGDGFFEGPVLWIDRIMGGLTAIMMRSGPDNHLAADKCLARTTEVFKSIWKNRLHVKPWTRQDHMYDEDGKYMEPVTCLVWHYNALYRSRYGRMAGPDTFIPQVGLHCWVFLTGRDDLLGDDSLEPLHFLDPYYNTSNDVEERDDFVRMTILEERGIGSDVFVQHLCRELERESVLAEEWQQILGGILTFATSSLIMPCFFKHSVDVPLVRMTYQITCGNEPYLERMRVWMMAYRFHHALTIHTIKEVRNKSSKLRIRGEDIVNINARGLNLMVEGIELNSPNMAEIKSFTGQVMDELESFAIVVRDFKWNLKSGYNYGSKLIPGLRAGGRIDWWPTLQKLQVAAYGQDPGEHGSDIAKLLKSWTELGVALKLTVEKERQWHERDVRHRCSWIVCEKHWVDVPQRELHTCSGCSKVRYCSRACQKSDWKEGGHKEQCKRIK